MEAVSVRLLPYAVADGRHNMAADEALLRSAAAGIASLRFYGWSEATLSLGYFQPERLRHEDARLAALPYVRRPSGGATLVHHHELTYALALPTGMPWRPGTPWLRRMHEIIAEALDRFGVPVTPHTPSAEHSSAGLLCFRQFSDGDLLLKGAKVVGSAQRRHRGAMLQHGGILLAGSVHTPVLPGIRELSGVEVPLPELCTAICQALARQTGWALLEGDLTETERELTEEMAHGKYAEMAWNARR
jgi:lipoate-protein ligase A